MKNRIAIVLASVMCGAILAATVPQRSVKDYYFTRPNLTNNIVGTVIGDPPAYHLPRSEDVAWLREAWAERVALAGGRPFGESWTGNLAEAVMEVKESGIWPLSETNRFSEWTTATFVVGGIVVTNVVEGTYVVTNAGGGVDTPNIQRVNPCTDLEVDLVANTNGNIHGYLSLSNDLYITEATVRPYTWQITTNIFDQTVWLDAWTNGTNFVSMSMTNGSTSVFTNTWRVYAPTSAVVRMTNVVYHDYFGIPSVFKDGVVHGLNRPIPPPLDGILATAGITNHYAILRQAYRLAKRASTTNRVIPVKVGGWVTGEEVVVRPNGFAAYPAINRNCQSYIEEYYDPHWDEGHDEERDPPDSWTKEGLTEHRTVFDYFDSANQTFKIGMSAFAAAPDGELSFKSVRGFALVGMTCKEKSSRVGGERGEENASYTNSITRQAIVPIGVGTLKIDEDGELSAVLPISQAFLFSAWESAGFPYPLPDSNTWTPPLRYECPSAVHNDWEQWPGKTATTVDFNASANVFFVLIDFAPRTSLPDW